MTIWNKTWISWPSLCLMWLTRLVCASGIWEQILGMTSEEGPHKDPLFCGWECKFKSWSWAEIWPHVERASSWRWRSRRMERAWWKPLDKREIPFVLLQPCYIFFFFISWRLITLQYCSGFCHTLTWISHGFTCIPHPYPPPPPPSPPDPSGYSQCTRPEHLSHASNLGWWSVSP